MYNASGVRAIFPAYSFVFLIHVRIVQSQELPSRQLSDKGPWVGIIKEPQQLIKSRTRGSKLKPQGQPTNVGPRRFINWGFLPPAIATELSDSVHMFSTNFQSNKSDYFSGRNKKIKPRSKGTKSSDYSCWRYTSALCVTVPAIWIGNLMWRYGIWMAGVHTWCEIDENLGPHVARQQFLCIPA